MADAFPGGVLAFDAANRTAVKMIAKTWLKRKITMGRVLCVSDAKSELSCGMFSFVEVTSRGYMLGYNTLRSIRQRLFRFLAKVLATV